MKYHVRWGDIQQTVMAGNSYHACVLTMQIHLDSFKGHTPGYFEVWQLTKSESAQTITTEEIVKLLCLASEAE